MSVRHPTPNRVWLKAEALRPGDVLSYWGGTREIDRIEYRGSRRVDAYLGPHQLRFTLRQTVTVIR